MKNILNVLALPLLNLDRVSVNVAVTLHRHNSMLDTNEMMMTVMTRGSKDEQNEPLSQSTHTIIVKMLDYRIIIRLLATFYQGNFIPQQESH